MNDSIIYALDFDGVVCDSAIETAITGWKAGTTIWKDMPDAVPQAIVEQFREVRPIIETGYEAILIIRLMYLGKSTAAIYANYAAKVQRMLDEIHLSIDDLKKLFGDTRDNWIASDRADWIAKNPLYPGVAEKLRDLGQRHFWCVITTKQERFVKEILSANNIELADERIFGMDRKLSKPEILKGLKARHPGQPIYFTEDRLPALDGVQKHPELADVKLFLALWGYNLAADHAVAAGQAIALQQLDTFLSDSLGAV
ncbi:HAD family hydrolase [Methylomonas sp. BW4-1]|uniref:HAD family hydrolase n=1 Tax=Methylomonas sp. BW4-1 TaxID=3376685 RepID=UPI0040419C7B